MNETQAIATNNNRQGVENEANVVELAIMLAKHKKLVIGLPVIAALVAAAVSFALPNVYMASTKLLPPQQPQSGAAALLSQLGGVASVVGGGSGIKNPNEVFIAMLKSRTVADRLVKKYDLMRVYGSTSPEKTRQALASDTTVAAGKDGLITIDVEGLDPAMVAKLANSYVDELLNLTGELAVTEAAQRRKFFERQLDIAKDKLAAAEMTLKRALDTRGVISVDSESRAILETVGRLRAQLAAKEIQLSSMQAFVTTNNPEYRRAQEELNSLRSELSKLENGRPAIAGTGEQQSGQKPVGLENIKILREVKYHQMLYELLAKQYEAARLDEAKDAAVIQVLDSAIKPERKYKPKRSILVLGAALGGLFVAALWAFMSELRQAALRVPEHAAQVARLKSYLLGR